MIALPPRSVIDSTGTLSEGDAQVWLGDVRDFVGQLLGGGPIVTLAIAGGLLTPTAGLIAVDTEGAAATDDLTNMPVATIPNGTVVWLEPANTTRDVVVKHAAGGSG